MESNESAPPVSASKPAEAQPTAPRPADAAPQPDAPQPAPNAPASKGNAPRPVDDAPRPADAAPPPAAPPPPAGALRVIGVITAIAVAVMVLVVLTPRLVSTGDGRTDISREIPDSLAGGTPFAEVPPEVQAAVAEPVFGTQRTNVFPDGLDPRECTESMLGLGGDVAVITGFTTPDATWLAVRPTDAEFDEHNGMVQETVMCAASPDDQGEWALRLERSTTVSEGGSGWTCCSDGLGTATAGRSVPQGAEWALLDLGSHFLAFEVSGLDWVPLAWTYPDRFMSDEPPSAELTWLSAAGETVGAESL